MKVKQGGRKQYGSPKEPLEEVEVSWVMKVTVYADSRLSKLFGEVKVHD